MPPRKTRLAAAFSLAAVAIYLVCATLVVVPGSTPISKTVTPYFSQTWKLFAPNIRKSSTMLEVRAQWRDDAGEFVTSDWIPVTEIEQRHVSGNPLPSRLQKMWNVGEIYLERYRELDADQRLRARESFIDRSGSEFGAVPDAELIDRLLGDAENRGEVVRYLRMDYMLMRYSARFASAYLEHPVERVQWRVKTVRENDFAHRFDDARQFEDRATKFGWRHNTAVMDPEIIEEFGDMIDRQEGR